MIYMYYKLSVILTLLFRLHTIDPLLYLSSNKHFAKIFEKYTKLLLLSVVLSMHTAENY